MTTNKPEVVSVYVMDTGLTDLVRLNDYEALQADRDQQYDMKVKTREQRDAVTAKLNALQAECEKLRAVIRRLCNTYVVDDYYYGQLREERLESAVNRAIDDAMEPTK